MIRNIGNAQGTYQVHNSHIVMRPFGLAQSQEVYYLKYLNI